MTAHEEHVPDHDRPDHEREQARVQEQRLAQLVTLKNAPMPTAFSPSLASKEIHCESKLVCTR